MNSTSQDSSNAPRLGLLDITLFMVTAGCSLQWIAPAAATGASSLSAWVIGGIAMFLPLSVSVVFLSARFPEAGGICAWTRRAFGPFTGFMTGWTYWTGTIAYLPSVLYFTAGSAWLAIPAHAPSGATGAYFITFSLLSVAIAAFLNVRGLALAKWLYRIGAVARWVGAALLVVLAVSTWWRFGSATVFNRHTLAPTFRLSDVIFWSTLAFCWTGPEAAAFMTNEIREPRRTVPRALTIAAPIIALIYISGTASVLLAIPPERASGLYGVVEAFRAAADHLGMPWLIPLGAGCVVLDRLGSTSLWLGALARIPTTAGLEHYLPAGFTRIDPRWGTPAVAIGIQAAIVAVLVILGQSGTSVRGAYNVLVEMMVVGSLLPFVPLCGAVLPLSRTPGPDGRALPTVRRAAVIVLAALGVLTTLVSIVLAFVPPPEEADPLLAIFKVALLTAVLLLGGFAIYRAGRARAELAAPSGADRAGA
ncbi:MAG: APC family permease [Proteobacteria bacterium]|nr:APC family permease [Pseudomonadota bacterium]